MNGLIEFLTTEEMIVVYSLVGIASVLYFIIYFLDKTYYKRKQRQNTRELQKIVDESEGSQNNENVSNVEKEPVLITTDSKKEEVVAVVPEEVSLDSVSSDTVSPLPEILTVNDKVEDTPIVVENVTPEVVVVPKEENIHPQEELQYTSIEPDPSEAQAELMRLTEVLEKAEEEVKNIDLTAFEEEQEQNAIISLDELMRRNKTLYENGELEKLDDEGNEPISLQDLEERMKSVQVDADVAVESEPVIVSTVDSTEQMKLDDFVTASPSINFTTVDVNVKKEEKPVYQEHKKFQSSPVISPVFGIERPAVQSNSDIELENTANYEKLDEEIRKTNEFLMTLKELQKKLD